MRNLKNKILSPIFSDEILHEDREYIPLLDGDSSELSPENFPDTLPLLPLRNTVMFPGVLIPIAVGREKSIQLVREANRGNKLIGTISQRDMNVENPELKDLYEVGTVAQIVKILEMPDGSTSVVIQGKNRFRTKELIQDDPYLVTTIDRLADHHPVQGEEEYEAIITSIKELSVKVIQLSQQIPSDAAFAVKNIDNPAFLINFISSNTDLDTEKKQALLEINDLKERGLRLLEHLAYEVQKLELKDDIQSKVKTELDQQQREYLLNQEIKTIQNELGHGPLESDLTELLEKAEAKQWSEEIKETFEKEIEKLKRLNPSTPEYSNQVLYLHHLVDLPWNEYTDDNFDLKNAQNVLDKDHFGLEKIKERIIEHLAVLKLKGDLKSPIICLHGPPGVGKTSLGKSIAEALGRKYVRMSLGGLHDEAEIRGHRKTYIGAMPGRIMQNIKKADSSNPVFILDEIDKIGSDFRGDPSFALLEVLDPEQNNAFYDNYLEVDFDLSKVMFIATANDIGTISPPLLDRMELVNVAGYVVEEKIEIAKRHLIRKQLEEHGLEGNLCSFPKKTLEYIVENYTKESGVRNLNNRIAKLARNLAKRVAMGEEIPKTISIEEAKEILGPPSFSKDRYQGNEFAGVVTGLAWTSVGGEILFIESSLSKGKGKMTLTGNLGKVMQESATLGLQYVKSHAGKLNIKPDAFENWDIHLHIPEGAIPKDGPSAGITMVTALASLFTQRKVRRQLAMTGEMTLRGKVLPVGGIKEKILAAKRADMKEIILCKENEKDILEIPEVYVKGVKFHYVDTIDEVLEIALLKQKVESPLKV